VGTAHLSEKLQTIVDSPFLYEGFQSVPIILPSLNLPMPLCWLLWFHSYLKLCSSFHVFPYPYLPISHFNIATNYFSKVWGWSSNFSAQNSLVISYYQKTQVTFLHGVCPTILFPIGSLRLFPATSKYWEEFHQVFAEP
jgi:hypothetical protein